MGVGKGLGLVKGLVDVVTAAQRGRYKPSWSVKWGIHTVVAGTRLLGDCKWKVMLLVSCLDIIVKGVYGNVHVWHNWTLESTVTCELVLETNVGAPIRGLEVAHVTHMRTREGSGST